MYSEADLDSAVRDGSISAEAAAALRAHVATLRTAPNVDEEHFRLITGFNDIFVSIAAIILLVAVGWIARTIASPFGGVAVAAAAWGLGEYFTRQRRMALPSIVLLMAFAGGIAGSQIALLVDNGEVWLGPDPSQGTQALIASVIGLVTAIATWLHWRRFMVPITPAVGSAAAAVTVIAIIFSLIGDGAHYAWLLNALTLVAGLVIFAYAMRWDMSDPARQTRRSDVAFWLHMLSAVMIVHPLFALLGINATGAISGAGAVLVVAIYVALGLVALAIDRRAMLVAALIYVLFALANLFERFGAVELNVALTALVIGSALLLLSAFWHRARALVIGVLPDALARRLPVLADVAGARTSPRPA